MDTTLPSAEEVLAVLTRILASDPFIRAPSLKRFLEYICSETLQGRGSNLKEYTIAVEGLGRPSDFDQKKDSIIRVQALKLRKRLEEYYKNEGQRDRVRVVLPEGCYVPEFHFSHAAVDPGSRPPILRPERPSPRLFGKRHLLIQLAFAMTLLLIGVAIYRIAARQQATTSPAGSQLPKPAAVPARPEEAIRILAGRGPGHHHDPDGFIWEADRFFRGGEAVPTPINIKVHGFDPDLFAASRRGEFRYAIPVSSGIWELHLFFAETEFGQDNLQTNGEIRRDFYISCNGNVILPGLDIYLDAGDANIADEKVFAGIVPAKDGFVHLAFSTIFASPIVNAIEMIRTDTPKIRPIRIVCLPQLHRDRTGAMWLSDRYVRGGILVARPLPSNWPDDPDLCRGERYGRFLYDIPVVPGRYTVNLYFTEAWFGTGNSAAGIGSRKFNVAINDRVVLRDFDVLKEAGKPYKTLRKSFAHVPANPSNKITLNFEPVSNYALINAIEILPE